MSLVTGFSFLKKHRIYLDAFDHSFQIRQGEVIVFQGKDITKFTKKRPTP